MKIVISCCPASHYTITFDIRYTTVVSFCDTPGHTWEFPIFYLRTPSGKVPTVLILSYYYRTGSVVIVTHGVVRLHLHETVARRLCNSKSLYCKPL